ncbi:uncharacterized protein pim [Eurosta solidaginis]|uniref:uncharacterized protein pim n=1 Tax=Eurosta solidaginis TaxID=178769 RepID=UPI003531618F
MANLLHDKRTYVDENKFLSTKLQQTHPRVHSVKKKQVFGELKNVMHNQIGVTPLKGGAFANRGIKKYNDRGCPASNQKSCKPMEADHNNKSATSTIDPIELFDLFDFPKVCCTSACTKSVEEIWAESNQLDDIALMKAMMKIRNGSRLIEDDDEKGVNNHQVANEVDEEEHYKSEDEYLDNLVSKSISRHLYLEDYNNDDFSSCSAEMPKFDIFNDLPMLNAN